jgi:hypothetical protein
MELAGLLMCSQNFTTFACPEPDESSQQSSVLFLECTI